MRVVEEYSHLNGKEYLLVHHPAIISEIHDIIGEIDASVLRTKISKEKTMRGKDLFSPKALNVAFRQSFDKRQWRERRYTYCVSTKYHEVRAMTPLSYEEQKDYLRSKGVDDPILSFKQTDFVKDEVAVEVQFGKYAFVAFDLFVKHLLFYSSGIVNVGVEIIPMKEMQKDMSSGVAYFEGEVYNILRHGRNTPAVPLVVIGIAP